MTADTALPYCRNCNYTLAAPRPRHCGHCGQETDLHPPSLGEFVHEFVGHYVALEGALWRTLALLFLRPGQLTLEYFHGRRRRYVLPLRIYLTASFVFFVGFFATGGTLPEGTAGHEAPQALATRPQAAASAAAPAASRTGITLDCDAAPEGCSWFERQLKQLGERSERLTRDQITARMKAMAPYALLALQPVFALLLWLLFAGSGRRYAEHFVFSLHMHAFWFLALLINHWADLSLAAPLVLAHGLVALRRVYGQGWFGASWRALLMAMLYVFMLAVAAAALAVAATLSG